MSRDHGRHTVFIIQIIIVILIHFFIQDKNEIYLIKPHVNSFLFISSLKTEWHNGKNVLGKFLPTITTNTLPCYIISNYLLITLNMLFVLILLKS